MGRNRWFVAKDVCHPDALDIVNYRDAVAKLDPDENDGVGLTDAMGRRQKTLIVSWPGVTKLARNNS